MQKVYKVKHLGGLIVRASDSGLGHNLMIGGFKPHIELAAVSTEPALIFCPLSLPAPH